MKADDIIQIQTLPNSTAFLHKHREKCSQKFLATGFSNPYSRGSDYLLRPTTKKRRSAQLDEDERS